MLPIVPELDHDNDFIALQTLADSDGSADILSGETRHENEMRWTRIAQMTEKLGATHTDVRLFVFAYRSNLALDGLCVAVRRLADWLPELEADNQSRAAPDLPGASEMIDAQVATLSYFCSDGHLADLRQSLLSPDLSVTNKDLFRMTANEHGVSSSNDAGKEIQNLQFTVSAWASGQRELVSMLRTAQAMLRQLERWLRHRNSLGLDIRSAPVVAWLARVEEVVIQHGAPLPLHEQPIDTCHSDAEVFYDNDTDATAGPLLDLSSLKIEQLKRDDILHLLEGMTRWFALHEPTNPSPYFLRRALRIMNADFLDIMRDLLPEAMPQFEKLAGLRNER